MKRMIKMMFFFLLFSVLIVSCNFPVGFINEPKSQVTPNATLTALFDTSRIIPATITPAAVVPSMPVPAETDEPIIIVVTATPEATAISTATAEYTSTSTVQPTEVVLQRANKQMTAKYLSTMPTQDGTYAEWIDETVKYSLLHRVYGAANWSGYSDLEGVYAAGWDDNYLYIGVKVTDDQYNQNYSGYDIYHGDDVEILVDTNLAGDFYVTSLDADDYQIGLSAGNPNSGIGQSVYLFYPKNKEGALSQVVMSSQFENENSIYRIEAAIPWSLIGVVPYPGLRLGFAVNVNDNDNVSAYKQQTMISTASGLLVFNPTTWGELRLVK